MMPRKKATVKEIARIANVSAPTAYQALQGTGRLRDETRQRVKEVARKMGYRPNRTAANMQRGRHGALGLLMQASHQIPPDVMEHMIEQAARHDQFLLIETMQSGKEGFPRLVEEDCVDGLILFENIDPKIRAEIKRIQLPMMRINTNVRDEPGCVTYNEEEATREAVRLFSNNDCRHPAILLPGTGNKAHFSQLVRQSVFEEACGKAGMEPVLVGPGELYYDRDPASSQMLVFLEKHPEIDCILLYTDAIAPLLYSCLQILGKNIPADVSIIGFNNLYATRVLCPPLSSFGIEYRVLARYVINSLLEWLETGQTPQSKIMEYTLFNRGSV